MKLPASLAVLIIGIFAVGCASTGAPAGSKVAPKKIAATTIVTTDDSPKAKVASYNSMGRFVVLTFSSGVLPKPDQTLFLYRNGLKVAELKVTGPQNENNIVADLVTGDAQAGDDVRDQ